MSLGGYGLCGVCCREITMRRDGRLRAHLAPGSRAGGRQTCDGSGSWSARLEFMPPKETAAAVKPLLSRAAAFNARSEWHKVDSLYEELQDMEILGANPVAIERQRAAVFRALDYAEELAPWWDVANIDTEGRDR